MKQPNILFLMCDQLQGVLFHRHKSCKTPNIDKLISKSIHFVRAYTPNAVCSPARASLMTGLLPHNHGVTHVTHTVDDDQDCLRENYPHFAQHLKKAGYQTAYFGKWHIERSNDLSRFGWGVDGSSRIKEIKSQKTVKNEFSKVRYNTLPEGYNMEHVLYGVTETLPKDRNMGVITQAASEYLDTALSKDQPWCCFVSVPEPHDPFICSKPYYDLYNIDEIEFSPNYTDDLKNRPNLYKKATRIWKNMTDTEKKEAMICYYASITEIDEQFGALIDQLGEKIDDTIIVLTTDHGEALGAHGIYCKNIGAYEEIYNIPIILHVPGKTQGAVSTARIGLHDLCPTLLDLTGCEPIIHPDSKSFAPIFDDLSCEKDFTTGFAEYEGGRIQITQRVIYMDEWKYVFNGFDFDELYNLKEDPYELKNLIDNSSCEEQLKKMVAYMWDRFKVTNNHSLLNTDYPIIRVAPYGPRLFEK